VKTAEERHQWRLGEHGGNAVYVVAALVWVCAAIAPATARAEAPPAAAQLALLNPLQLIDDQRSITAFRLSILRGANRDVRGLDLGATTLTKGKLRGLQLAGANEVKGDCTGMQVGVFVNYVEGRLSVVQLSGLAAHAGRGTGVQIASVMARAKKLRGFQFALITVAEEMKGLQLGLLNFNEKGFLPVFPLFNFGR
jgi:hypothetical protein